VIFRAVWSEMITIFVSLYIGNMRATRLCFQTLIYYSCRRLGFLYTANAAAKFAAHKHVVANGFRSENFQVLNVTYNILLSYRSTYNRWLVYNVLLKYIREKIKNNRYTYNIVAFNWNRTDGFNLERTGPNYLRNNTEITYSAFSAFCLPK